MRELDINEMDDVSGGSLYGDVAYAVGKFLGAVAATNQKVDGLEDSMLGAMQYGA